MAAVKSGEYRGKSIEAAISSGLAALGLTRDQVTVEIVRPGSRGLLGIGAEDAIVRISALPPSGQEPVVRPEPRVETRPERPAGARGEAQPPAKQEPRSEPRPAPRGEARPEQRAPERQQRPPRREEARERGRGEGRRGGERGEQRVERVAEPGAPTVTIGETAEGVPDTVLRGRDVLVALLERMGVRAKVEIVPQSEAEVGEEGEPALVLNVSGDDLGMLIGRQSEVLSSLQLLVRLMVNQQTHSRSSLIVDVNGYKAKRAESLRRLAMRTADQVLQTGRVMALEPMPPAERRIIHLALRDHPEVSTESVGEGARRKVTIVPKKG